MKLLVSEVACGDHEHRDECRYRVAWKINPHMKIGAVDFARAAAQHAAFVQALVRAGATIATVPFVHGAYDSVFAKDSALVFARGGRRRALLASPRFPERACEQSARADALARLGYEVVRAPVTWEGGDVVAQPSGRALFFGHGERSTIDAAAWIEHESGLAVTPLELVDAHLFHLDTALAILPDGTAIVCDGALAEHSLYVLERARGIRQVVTVPRADAVAFGLNVVAVNRTVIVGSRVPRVQKLVEARGFQHVVAPLEEFHLAGGSAACLVSVVHGEPEPLRAPKTFVGVSMDIYGPIFRSLLFPVWESRIRRRPVRERLLELERTQWLPLEELHAIQARALGHLLAHAYEHVPFYRRRFELAGITPGDILGARDLDKLPILRRGELRGVADRASVAAPLPTIRKQTSGTTGEPLVFGYEPDSEHWRRAVKYRGYAWAGYRPGDRALHFWGAPEPTPPSWKRRAKIALDRRMHRDVYVQCAVMNDDHLSEVVQIIESEQPQAIVCYALAGAELARYITRNSLRTWPTIPVVCGAERLLPRDRADLVDAFGPAVFDTYGCREVMMIGAECAAHDGMHLAMENLIVEIVVTEDGVERSAREGETGEVVLTDLHNFGMPFIRYANGDVATVGSSRRCACGRALPRIDAVQGRVSEMLRDGMGAPISGIAISFLVQDFGEVVRQFQAVQHKDRSVTISLVADCELPRDMLDAVRRGGERLLAGLDVSVQVVSELPRNAAGKHQLVIVEK
jgi:phenylacetate-coenzyme A ligase PaaK-like adenylate-forming protein/N-dimethylarginine dimethylaminohydrolase